jgi:GNAT superfamily N-acetyltransferase
MRGADPVQAEVLRREIVTIAADGIRIEPADPRSPDAQSLLRRYFAEMISTYQGRPAREDEVDLTEEEYPTGDLDLLLLAADEGEAVGCAGLRFDGERADVMRVFVLPDLRGAGLGGRLMRALETHARARGVRELRLDTRSDLVEAARLYGRLGYTATERFNDAPYADRWYRKRLT